MNKILKGIKNLGNKKSEPVNEKPMNKILKEIKDLIKENLKKYLPEVKESDLEENGDIFYMNGKNGTEFDWHVNDCLSSFMVFYNDKNNMGAVKLTLYNNGSISIYLYGDSGSRLVNEVKANCKASEEEILELAVILKAEMDDKGIFDSSIEKISADIEIDKEKIEKFKEDKKYFDKIKAKMEMLNMCAVVSAKITKEGFKAGYMVRRTPHNEIDSGWQFFAGNEDDDYANDVKNFELVTLGYLDRLDSDVLKYIENPVGTELIRVSSSDFEKDNHTKGIYVEKRE